MKKIQKTDIIRLIIHRKVAFLTLSLIIALGLGGFLASQQGERSMKDAGRRFFREQQFWDLQLVSSLGATEEDVASVREFPEVTDAEGQMITEGTIILEESVQEIQVVSLTERISTPVLWSGRLPSAADECALEPDVLDAYGVNLGDIVFLAPTEGSTSSFSAGRYLVTGTASHPDYMRHDTADVVVLAPSAFHQKRFSRIAVIAAGTEEADPFSGTYKERVQITRKTLTQAVGNLTGGLPAYMRENLRWIVVDRNSNAGYVNYASTAGTYSGAGIAFGFLFLLVIALVCFSSIAVIVEEEKRVIGITKAFGFYISDILKKYVTFGVGAALTGSVLGIGLAYVLSSWILAMNAKTNLFIISATKPVILPSLTFTVCAGTLLLCAATAVLSCMNLLNSPAELLLKGTDQRSQKRAVRKSGRGRRSLYFRMIMRNISTDLSRVVLSVAVVAVSCILIGSSVTVKLAHDGANERQLSDVLLYDIRVGTGENSGKETRDALEEKLNALGVDWCAVRWETRLFDNDGTWDSTMVIRCDADGLDKMIGLTNPSTGEKQILGDQGALIQCRIAENLHLSPGSTLTMLDNNLLEVICPVSGSIVNYSSRMIVMNRAVYERTFGFGQPDNAFLVLLGDMQDEAFREALSSVSDDLSFERADSFYEQYKSIAVTYNVIMIIITVIAVMISFVILINLANIYIARKKKELVILRMNGFSVRMCKAYVAYDALLTTTVGLVLGVLFGIPTANRCVHIMERDYFQFVRDIQPWAWIFAVATEALFALLIYSFAMMKIRHYSIEDLSDTK